MRRIAWLMWLLPASLAAQQKNGVDPISHFAVIGRGECAIADGVLKAKNAYACYGDTAAKDYQFTFEAMSPAATLPAGDIHICAGFRARTRDDRYVFGLKGGSFNALYLERLGFMGADDYLALRPLAFTVKPNTWYRFRVTVAGDRIRIYLNDEKLPRIDVRDALLTNGQVTLGGSYIETEFRDLHIGPAPSSEGPAREFPGEPTDKNPDPQGTDKERQRKVERVAYKPIDVPTLKSGRTEVSLDGAWLFTPGYELTDPKDATDPYRKDETWHVLGVPNFWNPSRVWLHGEKYKDESKGASDRYYQQEIDRCAAYTFDYTKTNVGWYRQWITLPRGIQEKHAELSFDAVSKVAEVWVNGQKAGSHIGMFGDFTLDVTPYLHPGRNLVTVKVLRDYVHDIQNADKIADVAVTVEVTQKMIKDLAHGFFVDDPAGIWQPVKLVITDPVHIGDVFIQPDLKGAAFDVTIRNDGDKDVQTSLRTTIPGLKDTALAPQLIRAHDSAVIKYAVTGLHPRLWSPEDPNLYAFRFSAGEDTVTITSGFRTFEAKDGFLYLNGKKYWFRGANQTAMPLAPNDGKLADKFLSLFHDAHINATRTHTVPFTETWLAAADRVGVGVSYEGTWPWLMIQGTMPPKPLIDLWADEWLDLLRKYRNHPSLLLWTVNNEMKFYDNDPDIARASSKMHIISGVVKRMRKADPTRPIVFDSNYKRGKRFNLSDIDDGDVDDIHMYPNWYDNSIFDQFKGEFQTRNKNPGRPLISQEMSTGYSNNETGHPVRFYTFVHQTAQALVGKYAYDYADPSVFLTTHAFITREVAEAFRRTDDQAAGILHFAAITWFRYVYNTDSIQPYPVYYAMKKALQPLLVSAELWGRHFYGGDRLPVRVCIVNDQEDEAPATVEWSIESDKTLAKGTMEAPAVPYYGRRWLTPAITLPAVAGRVSARLVLKLVRDGKTLSANDYDVVLAPHSWVAAPSVSLLDYSGRMDKVFDTLHLAHENYTTLNAALSVKRPLVLAGLNPGNTTPDDIQAIRQYVAAGGKILVLHPGVMASALYPEYIKGVLSWKGEVMNMDIPESPVFDGLAIEDIRYFNDNLPEPPITCSGEFQIVQNPALEAPASFTRVHGYLNGDLAQRQATLEKLRGYPIAVVRDRGTAILSEVLVEKSTTDPIAGRLLANMIKALSR
ncbi:MAG TPA: glycoside hydrolase family 2 TIM barrel-domain containing protein [Dinghuibacter sp.]|uniref:sugar-binding domain-containing protein n=1 Tax=Dinghuibacter sp. TaxID=2024697 RepID=UPI002BC0CFAB|nr:sugar-binding domain-containing protein [Dinghuibacter sp.]HTJ11780.1 glycoside hydrolase family 2 TIM barrel-domain containing protein [Dinghuibacter sp.]